MTINSPLLNILLFSIILMMVFPCFVKAGKLAVLPDLLTPDSLQVGSQQIYISEGEKIFAYSLSDFRLVKRWGKVGNAPGEFNTGYRIGRGVIDIHPRSDDILVYNRGKLVYFTKDGQLKKTRKGPHDIDFLLPVGNNFIGENFSRYKRELKYISTLFLFNKNLKKQKKIATSDFDIYGTYFFSPGSMNQFQLFKHCFRFRVYQDRIYLADTRKGFYIAVYDQNGKLIDEINKDYSKQRPSPPMIKEEKEKLEKTKYWQKYGIYAKVAVMEYLPAFKNFLVNDGKIYVLTFIRQDNQGELIIMDLKGNVLKKTFVPNAPTDPAKPAGDCFSINNDKYYYLNQNEDKEWELHLIPLNDQPSTLTVK